MEKQAIGGKGKATSRKDVLQTRKQKTRLSGTETTTRYVYWEALFHPSVFKKNVKLQYIPSGHKSIHAALFSEGIIF